MGKIEGEKQMNIHRKCNAAHTIHTYFKIEKIVEQMTSRPGHKSPKKFIICHIASHLSNHRKIGKSFEHKDEAVVPMPMNGTISS